MLRTVILVGLLATGCGGDEESRDSDVRDEKNASITRDEKSRASDARDEVSVPGHYSCAAFPRREKYLERVLLFLELRDGEQGRFEAVRRVVTKLKTLERQHTFGTWELEAPDRIVLKPNPDSRAYRRTPQRSGDRRIVLRRDGRFLHAPKREVTPWTLGGGLVYEQYIETRKNEYGQPQTIILD